MVRGAKNGPDSKSKGRYFIVIPVYMSPMIENELIKCPQCGTGKMRPNGFFSTNRDVKTGVVSSDIRGRKCDNCGHPEGGQALTVSVNERIGDK
jgi:hypothetical protein